jgi:hypothetical protein
MNLGVLNNHILELLKYYKDKFDGINLNEKNDNILIIKTYKKGRVLEYEC